MSAKYQIPAVIKLCVLDNMNKDNICFNSFKVNMLTDNLVKYPKVMDNESIFDFSFEIILTDTQNLANAVNTICEYIQQKIECQIQYVNLETITISTDIQSIK